MTKSKRQLRAEAVERLVKLGEVGFYYEIIDALCDADCEDWSGDKVASTIRDLLTDDTHESRGSYEERLYDVPVSDCPYCGCKRVVIHDFSDIYEEPHSYRVEHIDEKEAFEVGCFETYYSFDSAEKAVEHANMRDTLTDEPMDARRDSDGTCPIDDGTVSNAPEGDAVKELREFIDDQFVSGKAAWTQGMAIADMVERDYVRRDEHERIVQEMVEANTRQCERTNELTAERDELKRQLGTVSAPSGNLDAQSRAEIEDAERSAKDAQTARECSDDEIVYGFQFCDKPDSTMLGETMFDYNGEPVGWIVAKGVKVDCEYDADMFDSREKLEEDVRRWFADEYYDDYYSEEDMNSVVSKWLDRQAAITQDETIHDYNIAARESGRILRDEIAELKADNDCLRDRNEQLDYEVRDWKGEAKTQRNNFEQATEARKHWQRKYESVKAERDEMKSKADALEADKASWQSGYHIDRIAKLQAQRDRYRDLLSKAVDEAQSIVKLMEVES